jgi:ABC-2 type transport system permease protein
VNAVFVIAGKDLRLRLRDRSAIVLGFVAPFLIAGLMSLAFRGTNNFHVTADLVNLDHGPVAASLVSSLRASDLRSFLTVREVATVDEARRAVHNRSAGAAIVVPPGFSQAAAGTAATSVQELTSVDSPLSAQVVRSIIEGFTAQIDADRLSVATALATGTPAARTAALAQDASRLRVPEQAALQPVGAHQLRPISYYAPGMAILFVLFAVSFGSRSFFDERAQGTLDRIVAAPIPPWAVLAGKALSVFVYALLSLLTMAALTSIFFGADWGGPVAATILCTAMAIAVVALTAFVIAVARTDRQAEGVASILVFGLSLIGGNFILVSTAPTAIRRLALTTPNGWALRGFTDLATGAGLGAVVQPVIAILVFAGIAGGIAAILSRRAVMT